MSMLKYQKPFAKSFQDFEINNSEKIPQFCKQIYNRFNDFFFLIQERKKYAEPNSRIGTSKTPF